MCDKKKEIKDNSLKTSQSAMKKITSVAFIAPCDFHGQHCDQWKTRRCDISLIYFASTRQSLKSHLDVIVRLNLYKNTIKKTASL